MRVHECTSWWDWLPGADRIKRRPIQKERHKRAVERREQAWLEIERQDWVDVGFTVEEADAMARAELASRKADGWRIGRWFWWRPGGGIWLGSV